MLSVTVVVPCFNPDECILETVDIVINQELPTDVNCSVLLVDDASTDTIQYQKLAADYPCVKVLRLVSNRGRAGASHHGAVCSESDILIFLDSDCRLTSKQSLAKHISVLRSGYDVSIGKVDSAGTNKDFWSQYFRDIARRRDQIGFEQKYAELNTAYIGIKRSIYQSVGGYDDTYQHYGFEDRDLLVRLLESEASIKYNPDASAFHSAALTIKDICRKMLVCGEHSAGIFSLQHPENYKNTAYSKIDVCLHPGRGYPLLIIWTIFNRSINHLEKVLQSKLVPYRIKNMIVKFFSALYFYRGTAARHRHEKKLIRAQL